MRQAAQPGSEGSSAQRREALVPAGMAALMVGHAGFGQAALGIDVAVDAPPRSFVPLDVEGCELRIELEMGIGEMIVDPPGELSPIIALVVAVGKPGDDEADGGAAFTLRIRQIPYVIGGIDLNRAAFTAPVAEIGDLAGAIARAQRQAAERRFERLEQFFAQPPPDEDRRVRICGDVGDAVETGNLRKEKVAHEETGTQAN